MKKYIKLYTIVLILGIAFNSGASVRLIRGDRGRINANQVLDCINRIINLGTGDFKTKIIFRSNNGTFHNRTACYDGPG